MTNTKARLKQASRQVKEEVHTYTKRQLNTYIMSELETIKNQATMAAIEGLMGSVLISLNTELGIGKKRINRLTDRINK